MKMDKEARDAKKQQESLILTAQGSEASGLNSRSRRSLIDPESPMRYDSPNKQYIGI
jgi:hypothetical protein